MPNNEPKVRTRTKTRPGGLVVTKTITKGKMADGGRYREKSVKKNDSVKVKGKVIYGESTKKALGVTDKGKVKVKYKNKLSNYGPDMQDEFSGVKTRYMSPGVKKYKKSESIFKEKIPSETYSLRGGKNVTIPAYTDVMASTLEKTKKSKGRGMKKSLKVVKTGGYNEYGKKMKDIVTKKTKSR